MKNALLILLTFVLALGCSAAPQDATGGSEDAFVGTSEQELTACAPGTWPGQMCFATWAALNPKSQVNCGPLLSNSGLIEGMMYGGYEAPIPFSVTSRWDTGGGHIVAVPIGPCPFNVTYPDASGNIDVTSSCVAQNGWSYNQRFAINVTAGTHYGVLQATRSDGCKNDYKVKSVRRPPTP